MKIKSFKRIISLLCTSAVCFSTFPIETILAANAQIESDTPAETEKTLRRL